MIAQTKGRFFSVVFLKKDGEKRVMNGKDKYFRLLVGGKEGGGNGKSNLEHTQYVPVVDRNIEAFRAVNSEKILSFKCGKVQYSNTPA